MQEPDMYKFTGNVGKTVGKSNNCEKKNRD